MKRIPWTNIGLFLLTVLTTHYAGAVMSGKAFETFGELFANGWTFAVPLLLALGTHEMGHFVVARRHGLNPSWPYFIPGPPIVGTFGAVIQMRFPRRPTRAELFDVGIAGPLAGFVVSVALLALGARWSEALPLAGRLETYSLWDASVYWWQTGSAEWFARALGGPYLILGDSLLVQGVVGLVADAPAASVDLHPVAFAGWVGLFLTVLNLMPVGQLDGGHVAYALLGARFRALPKLVIPLLLVLGFLGWPGWFVWAGLVGWLGVRHPPMDPEPLGPWRRALAWCCVVLFILIFTPVPIQPAW